MLNIDYFERQNRVLGPETGEKIKNASILVIGVGAGGNELLKNLLLMGFGRFTIVDFDYIEDSNLSRTTLFRKEDIGKSKALVAAERLTELSLHANTDIKGIHGNIMYDIGPGIFLRHDFIVCCVDTLKARAYINDWCVSLKRPFFEMGFDHLNVDISFFDPTIEDAPCLREIIGQGDFAAKRNSCSGLKMQDVKLSHIPTIQVASAMAGVLVATEIIKYLQGASSIQNKMLQYHGANQRMNIYGINRSSLCKIHDEPPLCYTEIHTNNQITVQQFLELVNTEFSDFCMLILNERFVINGVCEGCGKRIDFNELFCRIYDEQRWCVNCRNEKNSNIKGDWNIVSTLNLKMKEQEILGKKLSEIGIPPMAILALVGISDGQVKYYNVLIN